jgi:hypothetical protein
MLYPTYKEKEHKPRIFKFENPWLDEKDLNDVVGKSRNKDSCASLLYKIIGCLEDLDEWGSKLRTRFKWSITEFREEMRKNQDSSNDICVQKYNGARKNLRKVLKQEENYWKQRSETHWLRGGDSNTKFFHAMATT